MTRTSFVGEDAHEGRLSALFLNTVHHIGDILAASVFAAHFLRNRQMEIFLADSLHPLHQRLTARQGVCRAHKLHLTGASVHFCRALDNVHCVIFHVLVDLGGLTADLNLHLRLVRDNIPSASGDNGSHIYSGHAAGVTRDRIKV